MMHGLDLSKYQGAIDWSQLRSDFVFIRAAYGCTGPNRTDPMFTANWSGALGAGIIRGAYHFLRATQPGKDQALHFLEIMSNSGGVLEGDLSPAVDIETSEGASPGTVLNCLEQWIETVETETKRRPIVYTGPSFWTSNKLGSDFKSYPLWVAHYGVVKPRVPAGWDGWTFWQYTDRETVRGIADALVDANWFHGGLEQMAPLRTSSNEGPGLDYGMFPKAIRRVKRAIKVLPIKVR
jgi:lysozyme